MTLDHEPLERELRAARTAYDQVSVSPDAWQENQRRLAAVGQGARRPVRLAAGWLTIAAAVVALVLVGYSLSQPGRHGSSAPPANQGSSSGDMFDSENLLGPVVTLENVDVDGVPSVHEVALVDPTGDGPQLCDSFTSNGFAAGGCAPRRPDADEPDVVLDWISGTSDEGSLRGVVVGVEARVHDVDVWLNDGERKELELHQSGWDGTQLAGLTRTVDEGVPQRLVAYGRDGRVLQAVDVPSEFGDDWLPTRSVCTGDDPVGQASPGTGTDTGESLTVEFGSRDARVMVRTLDSIGPRGCDPLDPTRALAGGTTFDGQLVVETAPEVTLVRLTSENGPFDAVPTPATGAPWGVVVLPAPGPAGTLTALDGSGQVLDRVESP